MISIIQFMVQAYARYLALALIDEDESKAGQLFYKAIVPASKALVFPAVKLDDKVSRKPGSRIGQITRAECDAGIAA